jgi:sugar lactone lactonase YvrE
MSLAKKIVIALVVAAMPAGMASASPPYPTYTRGPGYRDARTLTAYEPVEMLCPGLNAPEDMFIDRESGVVYVADTGNARVIACRGGKIEASFGEGALKSPTGVHVEGGRVYVADPELAEVLIFDRGGKLLNAIGRPDEPMFGNSTLYIPRKVASDARGNVYAVSDGSPNGVMQFNGAGEFIGFTGANTTSLSFLAVIQRLIYTDKQRAQVLSALPPSPTNLTVDGRGLLYTVTAGVSGDGVKKFSTAGTMLTVPNFPWNTMADVAADPDGNLFAVESDGFINVADPQGNRLFSFGSRDPYYETLGTLRTPTAIDVDAQGLLYVLDREQNAIVVYRPTAFALKVLAAVKLYSDGLYVQGDAQWRELLGINSSFILAYSALANSDFKQGNYAKALEEFRLGENRGGYSDAFWQIRNAWLQRNLGTAILLLIALLLLLWAARRLDRKLRFTAPLKNAARRLADVKLVKELLFSFRYMRHPVDGVYEMKHNRAASVGAATVLYALYLVVQAASRLGTGFVFNAYDPNAAGLGMLLFYSAIPFALGIVSNYLISSINDGEGRLRDIYIGVAYSLAPWLLITPFVILFSNVLTFNESFLYDAANLVAVCWSAFLVAVTLREAHDYTVRDTVKNILLTVFAMLMIVVVIAVVVILTTQEANFLATIFGEVLIRARN